MTTFAPALLVKVLLIAVVLEFILLRFFLRLGPVLPGEDVLLPYYLAVQAAGKLAFNVALLSAAGLTVLVATRFVRADRRPAGAGAIDWLLAGALLAAVLVNLMLGLLERAVAGPPVALLQAALTLGAVGLVGARGIVRAERGRLTLLLIVVAQASALGDGLIQPLAGLVAGLPGVGAMPFLAETLALGAALALPWSFGLRLRRSEIAIGLTAAVLFLGFHAARPWIAATATMWTVTFTLFLPGVLYAAGVATCLSGLLALRRAPGGDSIAAGLVMVLSAGLKLDFSYFALLSIAGLVVATGLATDPAGARRRVESQRSHVGDLVSVLD